MKTLNSYDKPREKIQQRGAASLSDVELLQALIGSGNSYASVARIAKRTIRLFKKHGGDIEYDHLRHVSGLGPARTASILAALEFARRYVTLKPSLLIDTDEKAFAAIQPLENYSDLNFVYMTLDGAQRLIKKRSMPLSGRVNVNLHQILKEAIEDHAACIAIVFIRPLTGAIPTLEDLSITRLLSQAAATIAVSVRIAIVAGGHSYYSVLMSAKHDGG